VGSGHRLVRIAERETRPTRSRGLRRARLGKTRRSRRDFRWGAQYGPPPSETGLGCARIGSGPPDQGASRPLQGRLGPRMGSVGRAGRAGRLHSSAEVPEPPLRHALVGLAGVVREAPNATGNPRSTQLENLGSSGSVDTEKSRGRGGDHCDSAATHRRLQTVVGFASERDQRQDRLVGREQINPSGGD
jgi:hypothetical protein